MRCRLSQTDIEKALQIPKERVGIATAEAENALTTKVLKSANLAVDMSRLIQLNDAQKVPSDCNITKLQWTAPLASRTGEDASSTTKGASSSAQGSPAHIAAECVGTTFNWESRYAAWRAEVFANPNSITPNAQQSRVLDLVHERRLVEVAVENGQPIPEGSSCPDPLLRLIHGLPGSGKTQLLVWIRSYFEVVWSWTLGTEFVFLAPLNSMASHIQGSTVHSWAHVAFKDRRGVTMNTTGQPGSEEVPGMTAKCNAARLLFIDEIEATGADTLGAMEDKMLQHTSSSAPWRYKEKNFPRIFGGMNVCFFGDLWQLSPTGQIAIMSDVTAPRVLENSRAHRIMTLLWDSNAWETLQTWSTGARVLELTTNIRSGADVWFSNVLEACRAGALEEDDYNFLHGYPTTTPITFWYEHKDDTWEHGEYCSNRLNKDAFFLAASQTQAPVLRNGLPFECEACFRERKRRARVLHIEETPELAAERMNAPEFTESVYITSFNKSVFLYSLTRARKFAAARQQQLFLSLIHI